MAVRDILGKDGKNCKNCEYSKYIQAQDRYSFPACYCTPYRGKWIAEIKPEDCPMRGIDEEEHNG